MDNVIIRYGLLRNHDDAKTEAVGEVGDRAAFVWAVMSSSISFLKANISYEVNGMSEECVVRREGRLTALSGSN